MSAAEEKTASGQARQECVAVPVGCSAAELLGEPCHQEEWSKGQLVLALTLRNGSSSEASAHCW